MENELTLVGLADDLEGLGKVLLDWTQGHEHLRFHPDVEKREGFLTCEFIAFSLFQKVQEIRSKE